MISTRWWKCDLQVATPAWRFSLPAGASFDFNDEASRHAFLDLYMGALKERGIEVIALADHNTGKWIDDAKAAGSRHGVIVFPGCEITTQTGSDGVHLIIIGDLQKTSQDFDRLLHGPIGFNPDNPTFLPGVDTPGSSSKTACGILDDLPDGFICIAPHVFNENGVASSSTVRGDIRWKAIHHHRLSAVDVGDCSAPSGDTFKAKFQRRELTDFPRLQELAFVSTSDAYSLADLGRRFTWIRMSEPTIEAIRQAFLDPTSRLICDWDPTLARFHDHSPNSHRHAWISSLSITGASNSSTQINIPFHPQLNVIIGGRGSGKSTVVAALRELVSTNEGLPRRLREDSELFAGSVFGAATLRARIHMQESQAAREIVWTRGTGSQTSLADGSRLPFAPFARVIGQKELFERVSGDSSDPHLASRSVLQMVDDQRDPQSGSGISVLGHERRTSDTRDAWESSVRTQVRLAKDLAQIPALRAEILSLQEQVDSFTSPTALDRLRRIRDRTRQKEQLTLLEDRIGELIEDIGIVAARTSPIETGPAESPDSPINQSFEQLRGGLASMETQLVSRLEGILSDARSEFQNWRSERDGSVWGADFEAAQLDLDSYKLELMAQGLSTSEFSRIRDELSSAKGALLTLEEQLPQLAEAEVRTAQRWAEFVALIESRREDRHAILQDIERRSGRLRFSIRKYADHTAWISSLRQLAGLRSDAFLEDVPQLAAWIWTDEAQREERWGMWRHAMAIGNLTALQASLRARATFVERLTYLDEPIRLRVASLVAEDYVEMQFLRDGGRPEVESAWQPISTGSPGQRTAAMLAFVLHHGSEPLILDQPEDDLDSQWIARLVVSELRQSRWNRQLIVVSHNANIPVLGDADQVVALENVNGSIRVRSTPDIDLTVPATLHIGPVENSAVRSDIQSIMEGGVAAFVQRERKYNNETRLLPQAAR